MNRYQQYTDWGEIPIIFDMPIAAKLVGKSIDRLKVLARQEKFPAFKVGSEWRIRKDDLLAYIDNQKVICHAQS